MNVAQFLYETLCSIHYALSCLMSFIKLNEKINKESYRNPFLFLFGLESKGKKCKIKKVIRMLKVEPLRIIVGM